MATLVNQVVADLLLRYKEMTTCFLTLVLDEKYYSATPQLDCPAFRIGPQGFPRVFLRNRAPDSNN